MACQQMLLSDKYRRLFFGSKKPAMIHEIADNGQAKSPISSEKPDQSFSLIFAVGEEIAKRQINDDHG